MFEPFTERARRAIQFSQTCAIDQGLGYISSGEILLGLLVEKESLAAQILFEMGVTLTAAKALVMSCNGDQKGQERTGEMTFTAGAKKLIENAFEEARKLAHNYIGTEHLLLGGMRNPDCVMSYVLRQLGVDRRKLADEIAKKLTGGV